MKKFLNMIALCLAATLVFCSVVACGVDRVPNLPKLATPVVTIDGEGTATWNGVENALYYVYVIDEGDEQLTAEREVQLAPYEAIKVKAVSGSEQYADSVYSKYAMYVKGDDPIDQSEKLGTPQVTVGNDGVVTWGAIANAQYYVYVINGGDEVKTTERAVTLTDGQTFKVKAGTDSDDYADGDYSQLVTYANGTVQSKLGTPQVNISANGLASWGSVANAQYYYYVISGGTETKTTERSVQLAANQNIKVKAGSDSAEYSDSDYSAIKTYTKVVTPDLSTEVKKYYSAITATSGNQLLGQVHDLITTTHTYYTSYDDCKNTKYIYLTDPGPNGGALEFYTQRSVMSFSGNPGTWNREHVWCKSLSNGMWTSVSGGTRNGGTDLHHIRPAEGSLNSTRSSYKFGEANGGKEAWMKDTSKGNVAVGGHIGNSAFEPLDNVKGDVARIVFYVYTHYNTYANVYGTTNGSGGAFGTLKFTNVMAPNSEASAIKLLLEWNASDPVDQIEITRNNEVYKIQGNRNPFIDHPEYANAIWG
ncbi:MAG: endonuclease [Clostridiales bacterium]|nr:endonuclease [Clostridiales bacterium]